jgi:hypothetical protein
MIFLIDHNLKGHALVFLGAIASQDWLDIVPIQFVTFSEMNLSIDSDDRVVWRFAQENQMILLTDNRSMRGKDSLEQVMREEKIHWSRLCVRKTLQSRYNIASNYILSPKRACQVLKKTSY